MMRSKILLLLVFVLAPLSTLAEEGEGIVGITLLTTDPQLIVGVAPNMPAAIAGIKAGDRIQKVEGKNVKDLNITQLKEHVGGPVGTKVIIEIERRGEASSLSFTLVRVVALPALAGEGVADARRHMVRGVAAIEMAKSATDLAPVAEEFRRATELDPTLSAAWYNLGSVQVKLGQFADAIQSYKHYLLLVPNAEDAQKIQDEVIKLEYKIEKAEARVLKKEGRYIAYVDGTILDTSTNLMWAARDNGQDINWEDAQSYCANYRGGGYTDWRMPTWRELGNGLCDPKKVYKSQCRGPLGGTWDIHTTGLIGLTCTFVWSSDLGSDDDAHGFEFERCVAPLIYKSSVSYMRVLPVRNANQDLRNH